MQIGSKRVPGVQNPQSFELQCAWLRDCDENHVGCSLSSNSAPISARRPTRLIDVGLNLDSKFVRLVETKDHFKRESEEIRFIALSHRWGLKSRHPHYTTTVNNLDQHKGQISIDQLPATFRDAVEVTKELGVPYLWIDSLCIIQDLPGDWDIEAPRMDTVFTSAYCVIAASRATGTSDGFLHKDRYLPQCSAVRFQRPDQEPFYVCEAIDDFQADVIEGHLNKRGWVFQERALARRTIYFTAKQIYWECGEGVRCESLSKLKK